MTDELCGQAMMICNMDMAMDMDVIWIGSMTDDVTSMPG